MFNSHRIIEHIASFTSQRDIDLLACSLLKTVHSILQPQAISIYKFDSKFQLLQQIEFNGVSCSEKYENFDIQNDLEKVISDMHASNGEMHFSTVSADNLSCFMVFSDNRSSSYMSVRSKQPVDDMQVSIIQGMLGIYSNFSHVLLDSQTDQLTGLSNRKTFDEAIGKIYEIFYPEADIANDKRRHLSDKKVTYWLALIDIDYFKKVNDTYGHVYGDEVLVRMAQLMRGCFRENDLLFRFGGEEFVLVLESPDEESCRIAVERLRQLIENTEFPGVGNITISSGVVCLLRDIFHVTLLDYADQALYYSKENGRNRTTFFNDMIADGTAKLHSVDDGAIDLF